MEHHFNTNIAKMYGIEEAILLHHFYFWIAKNAANGKHFHDGLYWTYNSKKAYADFFTYMNETKIFRVIKHLEDEGVVVKGKYNKDKWDKTNWYAITQKGLELLKECGYEMQPFSTSLQNDIFDSGKMNDGTLQNEQSILINNNTDTNTYTNKKDKDKSLSKKTTKDELFEECWLAYRRKGKKGKAYPYWKKLTDDEKQSVLPHIKAYVQAKELQYQQDFERYLRDKTFQSIVISRNTVVYDPTKFDSTKYTPQGRSIWFNEETKSYWSMDNFYDEKIYDGYDDNNRPNGAEITLNNARGTVFWNANTKKWEKK